MDGFIHLDDLFTLRDDHPFRIEKRITGKVAKTLGPQKLNLPE